MKRLFDKLLAVFGLALALSTPAQASDYGCKVLLYSIEVEGCAKKWRVEIETVDLDASAFNSQVQTKVGSAK